MSPQRCNLLRLLNDLAVTASERTASRDRDRSGPSPLSAVPNQAGALIPEKGDAAPSVSPGPLLCSFCREQLPEGHYCSPQCVDLGMDRHDMEEMA